METAAKTFYHQQLQTYKLANYSYTYKAGQPVK